MSELEDLIRAQISGVPPGRSRALIPFPHVAEEPLVDVLLALTKPGPQERATAFERLKKFMPRVPEPAIDTTPAPPPLPKGMVPYRRELWRDPGAPDSEHRSK